MKVVGYLRVSTDRQAEEGLGLEVQEETVRGWASAGGHRLVALTRDEGQSGSNGLETRTGLVEAMRLIRDGRAEAVVVARLDRLARDLVLQEQLLAEVRRMHADVFSAAPGEAAYLADDPADPSRKLIRQVLGAVAEYERAMITLRLRAGRARKAQKGGFAYGSPPYGFRAEGKALAPEDGEQAALRRIKELVAEGSSLRQIARVLEAEGFQPKRASRWHPESLRRIVARV